MILLDTDVMIDVLRRHHALDRNKDGSLKEGAVMRKISLGLSLGMRGLLLGLLISTPPGGSERNA